MHVLNLVTSTESSVFQLQVGALERAGITCTNLSLPAPRIQTHDRQESRSIGAYLRFLPTVLEHSFGPYDLVHANYGLTAPAAVVQPNLPVVVSLWGSDLMGRFGRVSKWCSRFADEVIVMSEDMAVELDQPCHVIPHGVDLNVFEPEPRSVARAKVGWDDEAYHVLFPYAKVRAVKNYPRAERVVEAITDRVDSPVRLQAVTGVGHEEMVTYYNAADVMLLTSRREGSPNTVKEALACNVPVVAADVGDVADQLRGVSLSAVCRSDEELADKLVSVLETGCRSDGREKVREELSITRMRDRIADVYEDAVAE